MDIPVWAKSYPKGMRWDAPLATSPVQSILESAAGAFASKFALDFMGKKTTYAELNQLADRAAAGFQKLGVGPGIHVGLYLPNTPHYVIAFFGVLKAGGTVVNYSPLDAELVLEHKVDDSQTDFIVTLDLAALYPQMDRLLSKTRLKKLIVGNVGEMTGAPTVVNDQLRAGGQLSPVTFDERRMPFSDLLDYGWPTYCPPARRAHRSGCCFAIYRRYDRAAERRHADARKYFSRLRTIY